MVEHKDPLIDSAVSYAAGGGLFAFATLADIATVAQQLAIILGCAVVIIRLVSDVKKLVDQFTKRR